MMLKPTLAALALFSSVIFPSNLQATSRCEPHKSILAFLESAYQEHPVASGLTHLGGLVEVLTTESGDSWSIVVTTPGGLSCIVAAGENWRATTPTIIDPEA